VRKPICFLLTLLTLSACTATQPKVPMEATVTLQSLSGTNTVRGGLYGSNLQWEHDGDGLVRDGATAFPIPVLQTVKKAGITSIRFPGGALANTYDWKAGIGTPAKRRTGKGFAGQSLPSTFGTDELIRFSRQTGATPVMTVNVSAGPQDAADWVEYLNGSNKSPWGKQRVTNTGSGPLHAVYWEIGNELYSPAENGHLDAKAYAAQVRRFATAMKKRDPSIKVGVALEASFLQAAWMKSVFPHLLTWNEDVLKLVGRDVDFLVLHYYAPFDKQFGDDAMKRLVWAGPDVFEQNLGIIRGLAKKYCRSNVEMAVTEYSTFFGEKITLDSRIASTENASFNAMMLMAFMRNPDVTLANHWSLLNNSKFGMIEWDGKKLASRPWFDLFVRLRNLAGGTVVPVKVTSTPYAVEAKGNIPRIDHQSSLQAIAVNKKGKWQMVLVNRAPSQDISVTLNASGKLLPTSVSLTALVPNDEQSGWLPPTKQTLQMDAKTGNFTFRLPPGTVSFIEP